MTEMWNIWDVKEAWPHNEVKEGSGVSVEEATEKDKVDDSHRDRGMEENLWKVVQKTRRRRWMRNTNANVVAPSRFVVLQNDEMENGEKDARSGSVNTVNLAYEVNDVGRGSRFIKRADMRKPLKDITNREQGDYMEKSGSFAVNRNVDGAKASSHVKLMGIQRQERHIVVIEEVGQGKGRIESQRTEDISRGESADLGVNVSNGSNGCETQKECYDPNGDGGEVEYWEDMDADVEIESEALA